MKKLFGEVMPYDNPFDSDHIQGIHFHYRKNNIWGDVVNEFYATIEASTFPELYDEVMKFCDSL